MLIESGTDDSASGSRYVDADEVVNNEQTLSALHGFIDRLKSSATPISKGIVDSAKSRSSDPSTGASRTNAA